MRSTPLALAFSLLLLACEERGAASFAAEAAPLQDGVFRDAWAAAGDRRWPGPDWYPNRVQDWRLLDGRLECLYGADRFAGRTVHLLTQEIERESREPFEVSFTVELPESGDAGVGALRPGAAVGLLLGLGGPGIDPRASALVQQVPAPGGGILACLTAGGLRVLDFSTPVEQGGNWTLPTNVDVTAQPALLTVPLGLAPASPVTLRVSWSPPGPGDEAARDAGGRLGVSLTSAGWSVSGATSLARERVAGGLSLFSARGVAGSEQGFRFRDFELRGGVSRPERAFGPVLGVLYTLEREGETATLRLSSQLPVLEVEHVRAVRLALEGADERLETRPRDDGSYTVRFEVPGLDPAAARGFTVEVELADGTRSTHEGVLRPEPGGGRPLVLATLSCVKNQFGPVRWDSEGLWFPHADLAEAVAAHDPDLLFFAGDQIYEGDLTPPEGGSEEAVLLDYHTKWQRFLWSFGGLTRVRPALVIPDDHDVFHGNLWGAGGVRAVAREGVSAQDAGGYKHGPRFVNAVHATQTSHLPPTRVTPLIGQGITTYTTRLAWGGLDACILADRMWKDSPTATVPAGQFVNGWPQAEGFDPVDADVPGARLLGKEQEAFLSAWADAPAPGTWARVVLSQSPFACLHTLPSSEKSDSVVGRLVPPGEGDYPPDDRPVADGDSNGWPQAARSRAVATFARAGALHLAGDQHLGTAVWYGLEGFRDGTVVFTNPSMANAWPRRWMPREPGANREPGAPRYTGDYRDGFGNPVTVLAAANPRATTRAPRRLNERVPGYGIVRFDPEAERITLEAWPRWADPRDPDEMYAGWPILLGPDARPVR